MVIDDIGDQIDSRIVQRVIEVVGHVEVQIPVIIVVQKRTSCSPVAVAHGGALRHIGECSIPVVPIEEVGAVVGHIEVQIPVIVVVAGSASRSVSRVAHGGALRHIGECSIPVVPIKPVRRRLISYKLRKRSAVNGIQVQVAIAIVVKKGAACSHRLHKVLLPAPSVDMAKSNTRLNRNIHKSNALCIAWIPFWATSQAK